MRMSEILNERSLHDVGVRGGKFYLAARGDSMDIQHLIKTGEITGVKGISGSREIWGEFSPNAGRDVLIIMPADETIKLNDLMRVQYNNADALIRNNSAMLGRVLSVNNVAHDPGDNIIQGVFKNIPGIKNLRGDPIAVANNAQHLAFELRRGGSIRADKVDTSKFGDWTQHGLRLSSIDDYANLYYQGAKEAGWYGQDFIKFFAPQNRNKWYPAIEKAVIALANTYANESEWLVNNGTLTVPKSSTVLIAAPAIMRKGKPVKMTLSLATFADGSTGIWQRWYDEKYDLIQNLVKEFTDGGFNVRIVDSEKTSQILDTKRGQRWRRDNAKKANQ